MPTTKRSHRAPAIDPARQSLHARRHLERDDEKDEEELDLEAALFGKKRKRATVAQSGSAGATRRDVKGKAKEDSAGEESSDGEHDDERYGRGEDLNGFFVDVGGMPGVTIGGDDTEGDGFFLDAGPQASSHGSGSSDQDDSDAEGQGGIGSSSGSASDSDDGDDSDSDGASTASSASNPHADSTFTSLASTSLLRSNNPLLAHKARLASSSKAPLWSDPSDALLSVSTTADPRMRRLVRGTKDAIKDIELDEDGNEVEVGKTLKGSKVEERLREQFKKMHPVPAWAEKAQQAKTQSTPSGSSKSAQTLLSNLLSTTTPISATHVQSTSSVRPLPKSHLQIKRLPDANVSSRTGSATAGQGGGGIVDVVFHPSRGMSGSGSMALGVVGGDRRLRMFSIDGVTNPSLLTLHIPSLPLTTARFHPSGSSIFLAGPRPFFYTYDLRSQRCLRSPKNLFGTGSSPGIADKNLEKSSFSPDGTMLAIAGRKGAVHVVSWGVGGSGGAGQLIMTLNSGRQGGVKDIMWMKGGREIWVLGDGSTVDVWDVGERRCTWRWTDDGGFGGTMLRKSQDGAYCAVGSSTGIVNVYNTSNIAPESENDFGDLPSATPAPIRSLMNLTTAVSTVKFNHDGQMLAVASDKKTDSFKAFHLPSATAFTNWPTSATPLGSVTAADFSSGSEYVAIGNTKGKVLLYSVSHYHDK